MRSSVGVVGWMPLTGRKNIESRCEGRWRCADGLPQHVDRRTPLTASGYGLQECDTWCRGEVGPRERKRTGRVGYMWCLRGARRLRQNIGEDGKSTRAEPLETAERLSQRRRDLDCGRLIRCVGPRERGRSASEASSVGRGKAICCVATRDSGRSSGEL